MRLSFEILDFLKAEVFNIPVSADLYLFGSRTLEETRGGDIDLLILSGTKLERSIIRNIRVKYYKKFPLIKLDIVNMTFDEHNAFKDVIMDSAILIASNTHHSVASSQQPVASSQSPVASRL